MTHCESNVSSVSRTLTHGVDEATICSDLLIERLPLFAAAFTSDFHETSGGYEIQDKRNVTSKFKTYTQMLTNLKFGRKMWPIAKREKYSCS